MNEKLKTLLLKAGLNESDVTAVDDAITQEVVNQTADLNEAHDAAMAKLVTDHEAEKDAIAEAASASITTIVAEELQPYIDQINRIDEIEADATRQVAEFKESYDTAARVKFDTELETAVAEARTELAEGIEAAEQTAFGMQVFEAFRDVYLAVQGAQTDTPALTAQLREAHEKINELEREKTINALVAPLTESNQRVARIVLADTPLERLNERFENISKVIVESVEDNGENTAPLNENVNDQVNEGDESTGTIVLESNEEPKPVESKPVSAKIARIAALAQAARK